MHLGYLVHDLNDPGVARRAAMLRARGIDVTLAGFWRETKPRTVSGCAVLPLSRTFDSRLVHRAWTTLRHASAAGDIARVFKDANIFLARNLEMLTIAAAAARYMSAPPALAYEVMDVHRTLISPGFVGKALRSLEHVLMRNVSLLVVSSPAFLSQYFEPHQFRRRSVPALVVENKLYPSAAPQVSKEPVAPARPWRIGWFGVIRCRRSMEILGALARRRPDLVQIEMHGRVAGPVRESFETFRQRTTAIDYGGPYIIEELPDLYGRVHFSWSIDYFEEGGNSEWLLPNRLYEGGTFDVVPMALGRTETGRWLAKNHIGVLLGDPETELERFLESLTAEGYLALKADCSRAPRSLFVASQDDCDSLAVAIQRAVRVHARASPGAVYAAARSG